MKPTRLAELLRFLAAQALRAPQHILAAALILAVAGISLAVLQLQFHAGRLDPPDPTSDDCRRWMSFVEEFGEQDDVVVVVEAPGRRRVAEVLEQVAQALSHQPELFGHVLHEIDLKELRRRGLYGLSVEELRDVEGFLRRVDPILQGDWSRLNVGNMATRAAQLTTRGSPLGNAAVEQEVHRFTAGMEGAFASPPRFHSSFADVLGTTPSPKDARGRYLLAENDKLGMLLLRLPTSQDGVGPDGETLETLRSAIARVARRNPRVQIGLTGSSIIEREATRASQASMSQAGLVSIVGASLLLMLGFRGFHHPLCVVAALLIGVAWFCGYLALVVGRLNLLGVSCMLIPIGLGISQGVHGVFRYLQQRDQGDSSQEALVATAGIAGPGIALGSLAAAAALFAAGITEFTVIAELGIIAGGGALLCGLAVLIVTPCLIHLTDGFSTKSARPLPIADWLALTTRRPGTVVLLFCVAAIAMTRGTSHLRSDFHSWNLQPAGLESADWERRLLEETGHSAWHAVSVANSREELLARKTRFLKLGSVERAEEIESQLPSRLDEKEPIARRIAARLAELDSEPPLISVDAPEAFREKLLQLETALARRGENRQLQDRVAALRRRAENLPLRDYYALASNYQQQLAQDALRRLRRLRRVSQADPPSMKHLPDGLVHRFVGKTGKRLLRIYPRGDATDMAATARFVHEVRSVDPEATGPPLRIHEASRRMRDGFREARGWVLGVVFLVTALCFRGPRDAFLALIPLALGTA
ncbi:MAG: MMPL family transporter, partial [Planctomycetales bacterium]